MRVGRGTASAVRATVAVAWGATVVVAVHAQSVSEATAESVLVSRAAAAPPTAASAPAAWSSRAWSMPLRVIELPSERPFGPPVRKHHALTWRNDALSQALGNAGWAQAECHQRLRLPSRWKPGSAQGERAGAELQLQVAVGCSF